MRRMQLSTDELAAALAASTRLELDASRNRVRAAPGAAADPGAARSSGGGKAAMQTPAAMLQRKKEQLLRTI